MRHLDGQRADTAATAMDQHGLPHAQAAQFEQVVPAGEQAFRQGARRGGGQRVGHGLGMIHARHTPRRIAAARKQAHETLPAQGIRHAWPACCHLAASLQAQHVGHARRRLANALALHDGLAPGRVCRPASIPWHRRARGR
ncbi:hypothetical protein G6F24_016919 [Rhizopus arrhizus]|nr:hypothetical protein G6F24_016919 [Rhizopus arrhizus]